MKALVILFDGRELPDPVISEILTKIGLKSNSDNVNISLLNDTEVADCLIKQIHIPVNNTKTDSIKEAKLLQTEAFCKDILGTIGEYPLADIADYRRKFIRFLLNNPEVMNSEIVCSLLRTTKEQREILTKHGLTAIPEWIKETKRLISDLRI